MLAVPWGIVGAGHKLSWPGASVSGGGTRETGVNTGASQEAGSSVSHPSPCLTKSNTRHLGDSHTAGHCVDGADRLASLSIHPPLRRMGLLPGVWAGSDSLI